MVIPPRIVPPGSHRAQRRARRTPFPPWGSRPQQRAKSDGKEFERFQHGIRSHRSSRPSREGDPWKQCDLGRSRGARAADHARRYRHHHALQCPGLRDTGLSRLLGYVGTYAVVADRRSSANCAIAFFHAAGSFRRDVTSSIDPSLFSTSGGFFSDCRIVPPTIAATISR